MKPYRIPNFRGYHAVVILRADSNQAVLVQRLKQLGLLVEAIGPSSKEMNGPIDVCFFDTDLGYGDQFLWSAFKTPVPLIAVIGSEAPGRLEWAIKQGPSAYLVKPIQPSGVFNALVIGFHSFQTIRELEAQNEKLRNRVKSRHLVAKAVLSLMHHFDLEEAEAFSLLRSASMVRRLPVETMSNFIASGDEDVLRELQALNLNSGKKAS
jgi:AmiR/NasT family two-component response regulator